MKELLSVSEARKLTGKSESTIKRMIREIADDESHEDRGLIEPSHEELERRKAEKEPYVWKVSKSLLEKRYPVHEPDQTSAHGGGHGRGESVTGLDSSYVTLLEQTNADLRSQNERQLELISELTNNQKQSNVLVKSLTDILSGNGSEEAMNILNMSVQPEQTRANAVVDVQTDDSNQRPQAKHAKQGSLPKAPFWQKDMLWFFNKRFHK